MSYSCPAAELSDSACISKAHNSPQAGGQYAVPGQTALWAWQGLFQVSPSHTVAGPVLHQSAPVQVSKASEADRIEKLGVSRAVGLVLVAAWLIVLVCTIVFRRRTDYESRKELHWWEAFYRTGSIIFGGGQVKLPLQPNIQVMVVEVKLNNAFHWKSPMACR